MNRILKTNFPLKGTNNKSKPAQLKVMQSSFPINNRTKSILPSSIPQKSYLHPTRQGKNPESANTPASISQARAYISTRPSLEHQSAVADVTNARRFAYYFSRRARTSREIPATYGPKVGVAYKVPPAQATNMCSLADGFSRRTGRLLLWVFSVHLESDRVLSTRTEVF